MPRWAAHRKNTVPSSPVQQMLLTQEPSTVPAAPVVADVETTGFGKHDKIVEIAIVAMDPESWETVDEYDTLLNPKRDMGPTGVHGISASTVEVAPASDRACFTGTAFVGGETWARDDLEALAQRAGLAPVRNVTKKGCDVLVAADVASASSKAQTARRYGKPIVSVADFLAWAGVR